MRAPFLLPSVLALAMALAGCIFDTKDTRVAGGAEDFPNTISTLGVTTSDNLSSNAEWDQFSNIPAVDLKEGDALVVDPQAKAAAASASAVTAPLAKSGATQSASAKGDIVTWDYSDTLSKGIARRFTFREVILLGEIVKVKTDTTIIRWNDQARDSVPGNELILESRGGELVKRNNQISAYRYENTDSSGGFDRATFYERTPKPSGAVAHKLIVVKPGPDGDFGTAADNRPIYFGTLHTLDADTLDAFEVVDADGDGLLWGDNDSGLVDVRHKQTDPLLRPSVATFGQKMRAVFFKQGGKTYPVTYSETRTDRDGKQVFFSVKGFRSDSAFGPGDTVTVTVRTTPSPDADTRIEDRTGRFRIRLTPTPGEYARNQLLHFSMETRWRQGSFPRGKVISTRLTFVPDEPLMAGDLTLTGKVQVEAEFVDGTTGTASGRFENKQLQMDLDELKAGVKLRRFRVRWDAAGQVLSQEKLPD